MEKKNKIMKKEVYGYQLTKKGMELGRMIMIASANEVFNKCPFCGIESYKDKDNTYVPYGYDFKRKLVYCLQCNETIITAKDIANKGLTFFRKLRKHN